MVFTDDDFRAPELAKLRSSKIKNYLDDDTLKISQPGKGVPADPVTSPLFNITPNFDSPVFQTGWRYNDPGKIY